MHRTSHCVRAHWHACPPCLFACLRACSPPCAPTLIACLPARLPTGLPAPLVCLPACLPNGVPCPTSLLAYSATPHCWRQLRHLGGIHHCAFSCQFFQKCDPPSITVHVHLSAAGWRAGQTPSLASTTRQSSALASTASRALESGPPLLGRQPRSGGRPLWGGARPSLLRTTLRSRVRQLRCCPPIRTAG
jgi:hypothetical protein